MLVEFRARFPGDNYIVPSGKMSKAEYIKWVGNNYLTKNTTQYIRDVYVGKADIDKNDFAKRIPVTLSYTANKYYRKMSLAEHGQIAKDGVLGAALKYRDTDNYRVWMSSSLGMVKLFHNALATETTDVIVEMTFNADLVNVLACAPHQNTGVQSNPDVIAVHREGFAQLGVVGDTELSEIQTRWLDHNLGVCEKLRTTVEGRLVSHRLVV